MSQREDGFWQTVAQGLVRRDFAWLQPLRGTVSDIVVFGCWDDGETDRQCREAYALLRVLHASRATVLDKEAAYIGNARAWYQEARAGQPKWFAGWVLEFVVSDMAGEAPELRSNAYDLAYCSGVLFFMHSEPSKLQAAVNTMARVVSPGGWVIACEDPGLTSLFEGAGLLKADRLDGAPDYAYCYRKQVRRKGGSHYREVGHSREDRDRRDRRPGHE
jgi:SAM-dependent methyltransferase